MSTHCPFLENLSVRFCEVAPSRKLVPSDAINEEKQRCTSMAHADCPFFKEQKRDVNDVTGVCPFFHTTLVSYCSAASDTRFVPSNNDGSSRCNTSAHEYCDIFLQVKGRARTSAREDNVAPTESASDMSDIVVPSDLAFSSNHMWMDVGEDGGMHVGVDSFLTRAFGPVDSVRFFSGKGLKNPAVILTVNSIDLPIVFPRRIMITRVNKALEDHPERINEDPYGAGWLFEHLPSDGAPASFSPPAFGLMGNSKAREWMKDEVARMASFLEDVSGGTEVGPALVADGGLFRPGIGKVLACPDLITMFNLFFSPIDRWRK